MSEKKVIDRLYAFIVTDPVDGNEGVPAFELDDGTVMPMLGADERRVEALKPIADSMDLPYEIRYFEPVVSHD